MNSRQWRCTCGFTHQFNTVQSHFLEEHKVILDDHTVCCGICKVCSSDPVFLKQHSVIHIKRHLDNLKNDFAKKPILAKTVKSSLKARNSPYSEANRRSNTVASSGEEQHSLNSHQVINGTDMLVATVAFRAVSVVNNSLNTHLINFSSPSANSRIASPVVNGKSLKRFCNSSSILTKQTNLSDQKDLITSNCEAKKLSSNVNWHVAHLFSGSDDGNVWNDLKSSTALNKMMLHRKLVHFYKCMEKDCSFTTDESNDFLLHLSRHNLQFYKCVYCFLDFASGIFLITHLEEKHGGRQYQCGFCLYRACRKLHVVVHHQVYHKNDCVNVLSCMSVPINKANEVALDIDHSFYPKVFRCAIGTCNFETFDPEDFRRHNRLHHGTVCMYPCSYCESSYFSVSELIQHCRLHGINNYQCTYCLHGSATRLQLLVHLSVMHADMPINVYVRSSDELAVELQSSFKNTDDCYKLSSPLAQSTNNLITPDAKTVTDTTEPVKIKLEKNIDSMLNESIGKRCFSEQYATCGNHEERIADPIDYKKNHIENSNPVSYAFTDCVNNLNPEITSSVSNGVISLIPDCKIDLTKKPHSESRSPAKGLRCSKIIPRSQIYHCCICSTSLLSLRDAIHHLKVIHNIHHFLTCSYCARSGLDKKALRHHIITKHINKHVILRSFLCKRAKKKRKMSYHHYNCTFCNFGTSDKGVMINHLHKEVNYKTYSCGICGVLLFDEEKIESHFSSSHPDDCVVFTKYRNSLIENWIEKSLQDCVPFQKESSNRNSLYCPLCNRRLSNVHKLLFHLYQHKRYKKYHCTHCSKRFAKLSYFNQHRYFVAKEFSQFINATKVRVPSVERWAKEIIQDIKEQNFGIQGGSDCFESCAGTDTGISRVSLPGETTHDRRRFRYKSLDIHLAGIYRCHYCSLCVSDRYTIERHCRIKHFGSRIRFIAAGQISYRRKLIGSQLHLVQCWQCKDKVPKHMLKKHRLKDCKWKPYDKHSYGNKIKLINCSVRKKYSNFNNIHRNQVSSLCNICTNNGIKCFKIPEKNCCEDQILSCDHCQHKFCSLKRFYEHWQGFHSDISDPLKFQLPVVKNGHSSLIYVYKCSYCNKKSSVFNILKEHVSLYHPNRIFKVRIIHEAVEKTSLYENASCNGYNKLNSCDNDQSQVMNNNITVNIKVEGLQNSLKLPVTYLAQLCKIHPVVMLKDISSNQ